MFFVVLTLTGLVLMDELKSVAIRPLCGCETEAPSRLGEGEDVVALGGPDRLLALGAPGEARQCLEFHEVDREPQLGACSHEFQVPQSQARAGDGVAAIKLRRSNGATKFAARFVLR